MQQLKWIKFQERVRLQLTEQSGSLICLWRCHVLFFELSRTSNQAISGTKPGTKFFNVVSLVSSEKISRAQAFAHRLRAPQDVERWPQMPKVWLCTCSSQRATLLVWIWHNERDKIMECDTLGSQHTGESPLCWTERRLHSFSTCASLSTAHLPLREYERLAF